MNNRFDISKAPPLRADRRYPQAAPAGVQSVPATAGGLLRSTLIAAGAAGAILVLFWLPAEYGIDPTGAGRLTGLTEMGEIKQGLAAEAAADAAAGEVAAGAPAAPLPPAGDAAGIAARLDRIDAQLAAIAATIGTPPVLSEAAPAAPAAPAPAEVAAPPAEPAPVVLAAAPAPSPAAEAPAAAGAAVWRDEVSYALSPGEGIEVKLAMTEGQTARFAWTANGSVVNYDLHGDGSGQKISYEKGRGVPEQTGELTAAFTGNHGWFWRNRTDVPVTVTLRTGGDYAELKAP